MQNDPIAQTLADARRRLIADFPKRHAGWERLVDQAVHNDDRASLEEVRQGAHRLAGLAGTVGMPRASEQASALEEFIDTQCQHTLAGSELHDRLSILKDAFVRDLALPAPAADSAPDAPPAAPTCVLVVEDDDEQRRILRSVLSTNGYRVVESSTGSDAIDIARAERPSLALLDVDLPGSTGLEVCRQLKADSLLAGIQVVFLTSHDKSHRRLAGLALGADEYLTKPIDWKELLFRIRRSLQRSATAQSPTASVTLTGAAFKTVAAGHLSSSPAALAVLRTGTARAAVAARLLDDLPRRDIVGEHGDEHLLVLLPGLSAAAACQRLTPLIERLKAAGFGHVHAGVAAGGPEADFDLVLAEADEALAAARYLQRPAAMLDPGERSAAAAMPVIVLADDDPDVLRITDAQVRAAGFRTVLAMNGQEALAAVRERAPAALVLDLMMPEVTGFEVLSELRGADPRPRVIVLSGRGREDDVTEAFALGADDYVTKPFKPRELIARISRLLH